MWQSELVASGINHMLVWIFEKHRVCAVLPLQPLHLNQVAKYHTSVTSSQQILRLSEGWLALPGHVLVYFPAIGEQKLVGCPS